MPYKPLFPFATPFELLTPAETTSKGVTVKTFTSDNIPRFCSFRTFGGSESTNNGLLTVVDTATLDTWYDPAITASCRIRLSNSGNVYEIIGTPEDIEDRHQWMRIRVEAVKGGA